MYVHKESEYTSTFKSYSVAIWNAQSTMGNISIRGNTYNHYQVVLGAPSVVLYIIVIPIFVCLTVRAIRRHRKIHLTALTELPWKSAIYDLPQLIFNLYEEKEGDGVKTIFLGGRQLLPVKNKKVLAATLTVMELLFVNSVSIIVCSALVFWYIFLLQQTFTCDPGLDCFALNSGDRSPIQQHPIDNCSDFEMMNNVTTECYRYIFAFGTGLSAFGGLLKFGEILLRVLISTLFWGVDAVTVTTRKNKVVTILKCIVGGFIVIVLCLSPALVAVVLIGFVVPAFIILQEFAAVIQTFLYLVTLFFIAMYIASVGFLSRRFRMPERESSKIGLIINGSGQWL